MPWMALPAGACDGLVGCCADLQLLLIIPFYSIGRRCGDARNALWSS